MATKKFAQMQTKKLKALLSTASDEDKKVIEEILAKREAAKAPTDVEASAPAETPAEAEAPAEVETPAEAEASAETETPAEAEVPASRKKMTDDECLALMEELKKNVNHRCQFVPFNTAEWVDGCIVGISREKRNNKILYCIKADDGRRLVKVHDSKLIKVLDEVVEPTKVVRRSRSKVEKTDWTPEMIADEINQVIGNVGKTVEFEKYHTIDENGEDKVETVSGRIIAIVPDKRAQRLLYRISVPAPIEGNPLATKIMHKVVTSEGLNIAEDFDEEGKAFNQKYCERREAAASRNPATPQDRVIKCEENLKKAKEKLEKAQEEYMAKAKQLEDAKKELDEYLASQNAGTPVNLTPTETPAENSPEEEPLA